MKDALLILCGTLALVALVHWVFAAWQRRITVWPIAEDLTLLGGPLLWIWATGGDLADYGALAVLRLGNRWEVSFHQALKRDAKGDVIEFDIDPRQMEQFAAEASAAIRKRMDERRLFALVTAPETRPYARMIVERMFPTLAVLSQLEIARGFEVKSLGTIA